MFCCAVRKYGMCNAFHIVLAGISILNYSVVCVASDSARGAGPYETLDSKTLYKNYPEHRTGCRQKR
jgi:hypothetical protein